MSLGPYRGGSEIGQVAVDVAAGMAKEGIGCVPKILLALATSPICLIYFLIQAGVPGMVGDGLKNTGYFPLQAKATNVAIDLGARAAEIDLQNRQRTFNGQQNMVDAVQGATVQAIQLKAYQDQVKAGLSPATPRAVDVAAARQKEEEQFKITVDGKPFTLKRISATEGSLFTMCEQALKDTGIQAAMHLDQEYGNIATTNKVAFSSPSESSASLFAYTDTGSRVGVVTCTELDVDGQQQRAVYAAIPTK